jgi:hypothetical protein
MAPTRDSVSQVTVPLAHSVTAPTRRTLAVSLVTLAVGLFTWRITHPPLWPSDFQFWHLATRLWLKGVDPYAMRPHTPAWPLWDRLFYPLPALLLTTPLAAIRLDVAHVAFVTTGTALLAWRLTRDALWPLWIFASPSFLFAALLGQWSPWLTIGALVPSAGFLLAAKPTLGLACWLYRPTRRHVWTGLALVALSLAVVPTWPMRWLDNLGEVIQHPAPITYQWGPLLALALLRWRTREAWFLLAMACVPQLLFFADQLPLFLVCRTRREALAFVGWGMAVLIVFLTPAFVGYAAPWALAACYLPALAIVLRRPNTA